MMTRIDHHRRRCAGAWVAAWMLLLPIVALGAGPASILIGRFEALSPDAPTWIAASVQQDLSADLTRLRSARVITVDATLGSSKPALAAARRHKADLALVGGYQMIDGRLRFTARLLDAANGEGIGAIEANGYLQDLFAIEDHLSAQLQALLTPPATTRPILTPATGGGAPLSTTGPVRKGDYGPYGIHGVYEGSSLQRAIESGGLGVGPAPKLEGENNSSYWYQYGVPYYPWYGGGPYWYYPPTPNYYFPLYDFYRPLPRYHRPANPPPANVQGYVPMTQGYVPMTLRP